MVVKLTRLQSSFGKSVSMLLATASVFRLVHAENVLGIFFSLFPHTFRYSNAVLAAIWASRC